MGTGEVTRYLGTYGSERVARRRCSGAIPPFLLKTDDNPEGVDGAVFEGIKAAIVEGPLRLLQGLLRQLLQRRRARRHAGSATRRGRPASTSPSARPPYATYACVDTWLTDFRADLPKIDVPMLVAARHRGSDPAVRLRRQPGCRS